MFQIIACGIRASIVHKEEMRNSKLPVITQKPRQSVRFVAQTAEQERSIDPTRIEPISDAIQFARLDQSAGKPGFAAQSQSVSREW